MGFYVRDGQDSMQELIDLLVSNSPVAYIVLDRKFRIHFINDYFINMRGFDPEKTLGDYCYNLSNAGVPCAQCSVAQAFATGKRARIIRKDTLPNGEKRCVDDYAVPLFVDENGKFDYVLEIMINRTEEMNYQEQMDREFIQLINMLSTMLEAKDPYTAQHSEMVRHYSVKIAKEMALPANDLIDIEIAASLHDIGKVLIPYNIINKPGKLTEDEFKLIQTHPTQSFEIIKNLSSFNKVKEYVRYHHEKHDGTGYPNGLVGDEIPLGARIVSVADTYDAMTSTRSYRRALSHDIAYKEILRCSGEQFDPLVVQAFMAIDFSDHTATSSQIEAHSDAGTVVRQLTTVSNNVTPSLEGVATFPPDKFIKEIMRHTPVAYALMDSEYNIIFTSAYFLEQFSLTQQDVANKKCYEVEGRTTHCADCLMQEALAKMQLNTGEMIKHINGETRYFECFAVPYLQESTGRTFIMEILLDRTKERSLRIQYEKDFHSLIEILSMLLSVNHIDSYNKSKYIVKICKVFCKELGLSEGEADDIDIAAMLSDVGMISIGEHQYDKNEITFSHPEVGYRMLENLDRFINVRQIIRHHHERYNGSGYPQKIAGEAIPLGSRMIYLAHCYYKTYIECGRNHTAAAKMICDNYEKHFDPVLVEIFERKLSHNEIEI